MPWDTELDSSSAAYIFASETSPVLRALADPGTGKSFALRRRIARLLEQEQNPKRILAVEMSAIDKLLPGTNNDTNERIEEQRRLFYVAITRCKDSHDGDPGTLIISSFTRLPGNEALQYGISASSYNIKRVTASRFIREFGRTAPSTTIPTR